MPKRTKRSMKRRIPAKAELEALERIDELSAEIKAEWEARGSRLEAEKTVSPELEKEAPVAPGLRETILSTIRRLLREREI